MNSLFISPLPDDSFEVRLRWPEVDFHNGKRIESQEKRIRVHVVQSKRAYQIDHVENMNISTVAVR